MDNVSNSPNPSKSSASRLRRNRAKAVKQRLYDSANKTCLLDSLLDKVDKTMDVQQWLGYLRDDVAEIKKSLNTECGQMRAAFDELKAAVTWEYQLNAWPNSLWDNWSVWPNMGCGQYDMADGGGDALLSYLNPKAPAFMQSGSLETPSSSFSRYERDYLLGWRPLPDTCFKPIELTHLQTVAHDVDEHFRMWHPLPKYRFAAEGTREYSELRVEAALRLQKSFRRCLSRARKDSENEILDQVWHDKAKGTWWHNGLVICYFCGEAMCNDRPGECCERRRREVLGISDPSDSSDSKADEDDVEDHLDDMSSTNVASAQSSGSSKRIRPQSGRGRRARRAVQSTTCSSLTGEVNAYGSSKSQLERKEVLHARVDLMIQFIEQRCNSKSAFPPAIMAGILNKIKEIQSWSKRVASTAEIDMKIKEVDDYMMGVVRGLQ